MTANNTKKVSELYYRGVQIFFRNYFGYEYLFKYAGEIYNAFYSNYEFAKTAAMNKIDMMKNYGDEEDETFNN